MAFQVKWMHMVTGDNQNKTARRPSILYYFFVCHCSTLWNFVFFHSSAKACTWSGLTGLWTKPSPTDP
jgi:hypothetical protein